MVRLAPSVFVCVRAALVTPYPAALIHGYTLAAHRAVDSLESFRRFVQIVERVEHFAEFPAWFSIAVVASSVAGKRRRKSVLEVHQDWSGFAHSDVQPNKALQATWLGLGGSSIHFKSGASGNRPRA